MVLVMLKKTYFPRLYRQAPLNSIWEGSGNVQCLDVLRAIAKAGYRISMEWRLERYLPMFPLMTSSPPAW